ncbi:MAG TPA: carboxypeptidase regulatory-like domain-containing protein [Blastocatellia bacterium]|nr:carboxypeptidase regulatory-like domain-containing protein [Blastocatellia bacterium]
MNKKVLSPTAVVLVTLYLMLCQPNVMGARGERSLAAAQNGTIEGTVTDPTGAVIAKAKVSLRNLSGGVVSETQTSAGGRFSFEGVAPGRYVIVVDADGFTQPETAAVDVGAGQTKTLTVRLAVQPIAEQQSVSSTDPDYVQLRNAKLGGESSSVSNLVLKRDVATITFKTGKFYFLPAVAGRVTAAVFIGEGDFDLAPILPQEKKQLAILTHGPRMAEHFTKMAIRFTDSTYDEIKKIAGVQSEPAPSSAEKVLDDFRSALRRGRFLKDNLDGRILMDLLAQSGQGTDGLFQAYFDGKQYGDLLYGIDPLGEPFIAPEEVILYALSESNFGIWLGEHLVDHYRTPAVFDEEHWVIDILSQKIDATVKGKRLSAVVETTFKCLVDGERVIPFNLFGRLRVSKVTGESGAELKFIQEKREEDADLFVIMAQPLKKDQQYKLKFEYAGDDAVTDSGGGNFSLVARENWYPNNTGNAIGDRALFDITLHVPKDLIAVATGDLVSESQDNGYSVTRWKCDVPLDVAGFNYGRFKKESVKDPKTNKTIESYANKDIPDYLKSIQRGAEQMEEAGLSTDTTFGAINTVSLMSKARTEAQLAVALYTDMFGPLPYDRVAMTQQPFFDFGQAWPMLVYMPVLAYLDSTYRHQLGMSGTDTFVKIVGPHEVSHQWWGHVIGWKSYRDQWMSEGFADFSASLFAQSFYGKTNLFSTFWKEQREMILTKNQMGKRPGDVGSVWMGYRLNTAKTGDFVTQSVIYPKGAFILHMIRMMMWDPKTGDKAFSEMMKDFVKTYFNTNVSTQDFQKIVEKHMTREMDLDANGKMNWFFNEWVYGTEIPDYKLDYKVEEGQDGIKLVAKLTQSNVSPDFKMRVPIYLDFGGKVTRLGSATITGNTTTPEFTVKLPQKPKRVMVAHFEDVLCTTSDR